MKVIFVDVDGVLNSRQGPIRNGLLDVSLNKVDMLRQIVNRALVLL